MTTELVTASTQQLVSRTKLRRRPGSLACHHVDYVRSTGPTDRNRLRTPPVRTGVVRHARRPYGEAFSPLGGCPAPGRLGTPFNASHRVASGGTVNAPLRVCSCSRPPKRWELPRGETILPPVVSSIASPAGRRGVGRQPYRWDCDTGESRRFASQGDLQNGQRDHAGHHARGEADEAAPSNPKDAVRRDPNRRSPSVRSAAVLRQERASRRAPNVERRGSRPASVHSGPISREPLGASPGRGAPGRRATGPAPNPAAAHVADPR